MEGLMNNLNDDQFERGKKAFDDWKNCIGERFLEVGRKYFNKPYKAYNQFARFNERLYNPNKSWEPCIKILVGYETISIDDAKTFIKELNRIIENPCEESNYRNMPSCADQLAQTIQAINSRRNGIK